MQQGPFSIAGKSFLVAGGTRGIGRAISLQFARSGATVLANYVRGDSAAADLVTEAEKERIGISLCRADLTTPNGIAALEQALDGLNLPLDGLVYCAATGVHRPFEQLTLRHYDWTFALNVRAFFDVVHKCLQRFSRAASVIALSSQGAVRVVPAYSLIGSSKGALEAMARHMAVELAPRGVRVNILAPGAVETQAWDAMPEAKARLNELARHTPIGRLVTVEDVAEVAHFLCSDAAKGIVGQTVVVDGGAGITT